MDLLLDHVPQAGPRDEREVPKHELELVFARKASVPTGKPLGSEQIATTLLYEEGPYCQGHDSLVVTSTLTSVTVRRIVDGIEQRSSLYGLLREGQGHVGGCSGGPIP